MLKVLRLILESFRFAGQALKANLLRTVLSLVGVTIGIFTMISVFTAVDSLERSINKSLRFLGAENINVEKWPLIFDRNYPWWKYFNRPHVSYREYEFLNEKLQEEHDGITIFISKANRTVKSGSSSTSVNVIGASDTFVDVYELYFDEGRFLNKTESENAMNVAIIGNRIREDLFPFQSAMGRVLKINGLKYTIVGVLAKEGEGILETNSNDDSIYIPYRSYAKMYNTHVKWLSGPKITVRALDAGASLDRIEGELRGVMRGKRGLRPKQKDSFALNRQETFLNVMDRVFAVLGLAGALIGSFSILVGGFGIANIMFVSVQERTPIIGIQKSLGAKNYFILWQFLFESVFLSLIGGLFGIALVYLASELVSSHVDLGDFRFVMTMKNVVAGLVISCVIGILSGIIPAAKASRMDPVAAIRA